MQITWNGLGSFTIIAKPIQGDVTLVTDPFDNETGLRFPRSLAASIVLQSHDGLMAKNVGSISGEESKLPFVIDHPGEYEVKGMFAHGIRAPKKDGTEHTIFRVSAEGMRIAFLGAIDRELTDKEVERLGNIDVLVVPVGGGDVLDKEKANAVVSQIEPRLVIPSHYETKGEKIKHESVAAFCKELACPNEETNKLKLTKSSLPQEDIRIAILTR